MTILRLICFAFHAISKPFSRPKIFFLKKVFNHFCKLLSDINLLCFSLLAKFWYSFFSDKSLCLVCGLISDNQELLHECDDYGSHELHLFDALRSTSQEQMG